MIVDYTTHQITIIITKHKEKHTLILHVQACRKKRFKMITFSINGNYGNAVYLVGRVSSGRGSIGTLCQCCDCITNNANG